MTDQPSVTGSAAPQSSIVSSTIADRYNQRLDLPNDPCTSDEGYDYDHFWVTPRGIRLLENLSLIHWLYERELCS